MERNGSNTGNNCSAINHCQWSATTAEASNTSTSLNPLRTQHVMCCCGETNKANADNSESQCNGGGGKVVTTVEVVGMCCDNSKKSADYENMHFVPYQNLDFTVGHDPQFPPPPSPPTLCSKRTSLLEETSSTTGENCEHFTSDEIVDCSTFKKQNCIILDETKLSGPASNCQSEADSSEHLHETIVLNCTTNGKLSVARQPNCVSGDCSQSQMTELKSSVLESDKQVQHKCLNTNAPGTIHSGSDIAGNSDSDCIPVQNSRTIVGPSILPSLASLPLFPAADQCDNCSGEHGHVNSQSTCDRILSSNATICQQSSPAHLHTSVNINGTRQFMLDRDKSRSIPHITNNEELHSSSRLLEPFAAAETQRRRHKSVETLSSDDSSDNSSDNDKHTLNSFKPFSSPGLFSSQTILTSKG